MKNVGGIHRYSGNLKKVNVFIPLISLGMSPIIFRLLVDKVSSFICKGNTNM